MPKYLIKTVTIFEKMFKTSIFVSSKINAKCNIEYIFLTVVAFV